MIAVLGINRGNFANVDVFTQVGVIKIGFGKV